MWTQVYAPIGGSLGLSAIAAAAPIIVLFVMLGALRKPAWMAAVSALASAFVVAIAVYGMPLKLAVISVAYGGAYGLFPIAWIVFASIMLYRLAVETGKFEVIKDSVGALTDDRRLQADEGFSDLSVDLATPAPQHAFVRRFLNKRVFEAVG